MYILRYWLSYFYFSIPFTVCLYMYVYYCYTVDLLQKIYWRMTSLEFLMCNCALLLDLSLVLDLASNCDSTIDCIIIT